MTLKQAIKTLEHHQKWRKGANIKLLDPKVISEAIEIAIHLMKGLK